MKKYKINDEYRNYNICILITIALVLQLVPLV